MDMHLWVWKPTYMIRRFEDFEAHARDDPYSVSRFGDNVLLKLGRHAIQTLITGGSLSSGGSVVYPYSNANARLGVGNSSAEENEAHNGLQGTSTEYGPMDTSYPTVTGTVATYRTTFEANEANFDWKEFALRNTVSANGQNMFRKVSNQGTKAEGQLWELTVAVDLTAGSLP